MPRCSYPLPLAAALVALAAAAPAAQATSVTRTQGEQGLIVTIEDTAALNDDLTLSGSVAGGVTVQSAATALTAGSGCAATSATVVTCQPGASEVFAILGAGNDKFVLTATDLKPTVNGGTGLDFVDLADSPGADAVIGGPGVDTVSYEKRSTPVKVTLDDVANDGVGPIRAIAGSDEHDNIGSDVEKLVGGRAADSLTGGPGDETLIGNGGNDRLNGLAGNDALLGGPGDDTELGGAGDDVLGRGTLVSQTDFGINDPGADTFKGEDGIDLLVTADGVKDTLVDCGAPSPVEFGGDTGTRDLLDPDPVGCEQGSIAAKDQHPTVQLLSHSLKKSGGRVALRLKCPKAAPGNRCAGTVKLLRGKRSLGSAAYRIAEGASRTVSLAVKGGPGTVDVWTHESDTTGRAKDTHNTVRLG
jgi:Ca2+-binding RTX toxin-like protein